MAKNTGGMPDGMKSVMGWTLGVGIIAFTLLILVIIFGNLSGNVGFTQDSDTIVNETIVFSDGGNIPSTADNRVNGNLTNVIVSNATTQEVVPSTNYSVSGVTVTSVSGSPWNGTNVNVSGDLVFDSQGQIDSENIILNYTLSATNTSAQFPTVGTIIGIAILLLILIALLVFAIRRMMGVAGSTGVSGGSSKFTGSDRDFG